MNKIFQGDCLEVLKELEDNSVDSIVTDPPYELGFMGKSWDNTGIANNKEMWAECLRVLKPGGHLLAFSGTRTYHRMASAIEDAGFEVRDMIEWVYGSGFPKSLNIGKAVDKLQGNDREVLGLKQYAGPSGNNRNFGVGNVDEGENKRIDTKGTSEWEGWGTALKPAHEPICMARKPKDDKFILDACCGGKMFWFDKNQPNTLYIDKRICEKGHNKAKPNHEVKPDMLMDFTDLQFADKTFNMVVFDPPHLFLGETSKLAKDYGTLKNTNWEEDIKKGFSECFRVLKNYGTLVFKWNEFDIPVKKILSLTNVKPLFGQRSGKQGKTHWIVFMKIPQEHSEEITPNHNPICMARKPLSEETVANNVLKWGTGGINIDESRVGNEEITSHMRTDTGIYGKYAGGEDTKHMGRFPANLIHDNSEEVRECFPDNIKGEIGRAGRKSGGNYEASSYKIGVVTEIGFKDNGNASRFFKSIINNNKYYEQTNERDTQTVGFNEVSNNSSINSSIRPSFKSIIYQAKASKSERNKGCEGLEEKQFNNHLSEKLTLERTDSLTSHKNNHPTVKPIALMEYLIKMVTPKGGIVLDPFAGSGSTLVAAKQNGFKYIGIEMTEEYIPIIEARLNSIDDTLFNS